MQHLLEKIKAFNEHQTLKEIDAIPKLVSKETSDLNYKLMFEENEEYLDACKNNNLIEIADALGDEFVVLWGKICKHGLHEIFFDKILAPIVESNESKYCLTRDEAIKSMTLLEAKTGDKHHYSNWQGKYVIFNSETGKLAKGFGYKSPVISID